ncbi:universal stress protein UspA family protein [Loigolactobacillus rennini DSM 20253]|uniref:Universal stress protein UspA family protein n=2 Tax=Loigolactobacillus rennini TaxID=238013 RepID=A0A0R2CUX9_9LACO|nr:universal stress protein UspA family protein [Loigolactobacillus rennini DSM 20253]
MVKLSYNKGGNNIGKRGNVMLQEYRNILVPMDGSDEAELALAKAIAVAKRNQAHIDLLNILDTKQYSYNYAGLIDGDVIYKMSEDAQDYLEGIVKRAKEKDGFTDITIHVRFGSPKTVIAQDFPAEHHNDLIMIGATGLNAVERVLVGSVTEYVNRHALPDVLVVKTELDNHQILGK